MVAARGGVDSRLPWTIGLRSDSCFVLSPSQEVTPLMHRRRNIRRPNIISQVHSTLNHSKHSISSGSCTFLFQTLNALAEIDRIPAGTSQSPSSKLLAKDSQSLAAVEVHPHHTTDAISFSASAEATPQTTCNSSSKYTQSYHHLTRAKKYNRRRGS